MTGNKRPSCPSALASMLVLARASRLLDDVEQEGDSGLSGFPDNFSLMRQQLLRVWVGPSCLLGRNRCRTPAGAGQACFQVFVGPVFSLECERARARGPDALLCPPAVMASAEQPIFCFQQQLRA